MRLTKSWLATGNSFWVNTVHKNPLSWEAAFVDGLWTFKNIETGRYLGHVLDVVIKQSEDIKTTTHPFIWQVKRDVNGWLKLSVPYTNFVLDMEINERRKVMTCNSHGQSNQRWILNPDKPLQFPIEPGTIYKIICSEAGTVVNLDDSGVVSGHHYNEGRNQKWEAIPTNSDTWLFKNHFSGKYLGIWVDLPANGTLVGGTDNPFAWDVIPKYVNGKLCNRNSVILRVPSTELHLDLRYQKKDPGTRIQLWWNVVNSYWILSKV
ncbi:hypothetical protein D9611_014373 [Ephemerocybe angulata]|uniref:Ricin B lectin domain-containing protein n=1 Tax=Ephemerocybe angulata TaxID=980116 RepID=A0A8H5BU04_9AGAR|nr:hypothetical protein D9611_014373 [Tulosesus angulatus]